MHSMPRIWWKTVCCSEEKRSTHMFHRPCPSHQDNTGCKAQPPNLKSFHRYGPQPAVLQGVVRGMGVLGGWTNYKAMTSSV